MFTDVVKRAAAESGGTLCVGLDPHLDLLPKGAGRAAQRSEQFLAGVIDRTVEHTCVYKPNSAFFEALGAEGWRALERTIERIHRLGRPVILDAKRGDITSTARAYAKAAFDMLGADAITLVPYMGEDAVVPFLDAGGFGFLLALPSNASAQTIVNHGVPPVFEQVIGMATDLDLRYPGRVGLVVAATRIDAARRADEISGSIPWLVPGIGAQGGDIRNFLSCVRRDRLCLISASRSIVFADDPGAAAAALKRDIEEAGHA